MYIKVDKILPNPEQPRKTFDQADLEVLAESIREHGLLNPIAVEDAGEAFILIDGERRWRAAKLAGLTEIEASVRPSMNGNGQRDRLVLAIVGNIQRKDMNPVEQAQAFQRLRSAGYSAEQIAGMVNLSSSQVLNYLRLLDLEIEIQGLLASGRLPFETSGLQALRSIEDSDRRIMIAQMAAKNNLSGPGLARMAKRMGFSRPEAIRPSPKQQAQEVSRKDRIQAAGGRWNMIAQLGYRPAEAFARAAEETCKACPLYDVASNVNCKDCPAVDLLRRLTK